MEFRQIDKSNYWDCIELVVDKSQEGFVADNKQSLVEAAYEDGLYIVNPGSVAMGRSAGNSYAIIDIEKNGTIPIIVKAP